VLDGLFAIHRLDAGAEVPQQLLTEEFLALTRTADELSIVCSQDLPIASDKQEPGWRCLKVEGPLDFGLTGVLAGISRALAEAEISVFAISTFDTDYLLIRAEQLDTAIAALRRAGYELA
jgi:hypothetical protein